MVTIVDVAKYILARRGEMSTMKLQKLCYYSQAWHLVWRDKPLFREDFQAWANGPVCRELFDIHHGLFSVDASTPGIVSGNVKAIKPEQKSVIDQVLRFYGGKNGQYLSRLTHLEKPWIQARGGLPDGENCENVITKESMSMYYGAL